MGRLFEWIFQLSLPKPKLLPTKLNHTHNKSIITKPTKTTKHPQPPQKPSTFPKQTTHSHHQLLTATTNYSQPPLTTQSHQQLFTATTNYSQPPLTCSVLRCSATLSLSALARFSFKTVAAIRSLVSSILRS